MNPSANYEAHLINSMQTDLKNKTRNGTKNKTTFGSAFK